MANPNDNIRRLYENGLKHFSLPDFDTFQQDMKDEQKRRRFYNNMQQAYSLPDFDTFSTDIGAVTPATASAASTPAPAQPQPTTASTVKPITDNTAQQATVQPTVETSAQPAQPQGWKPSAIQQRAFQMQMEQSNARMQQQSAEFQQRMEGIKKGNKPGAFMGEKEFNPETGQMETHYYTTQGDRVGTQMEQSQRDTAHREWWENNTEEGKRSKEQRLQREFDARLSVLWNDPTRAAAAESAWDAAEKAYYKEVDKNRDETNLMMMTAGNSTDAAAFKQMETVENFKDRLTTHDMDALMQTAWDNLGEKGQQALIDDCYQMLRYRNPGVDELVLYNQAKEFARQQSNLRLYNLAVERNAPKNSLEYFMRKIGDMNLVTNIGRGIAVNQVGGTGDMAAYEAANEQYRLDGHKVLDVVGTVVGFAVDPTTWMSAGVGGAAARGTLSIGGRILVGRGASAAVANAAARQFGTSMTGRIVGGIVGGAANFGTYEGVKEMETQFAHGGHIVGRDESGRYINEGYSASAVAGQALHGTLMGGAIGWLGPVSGNVSDKLVRATSSTVGKVMGRAGVYTGATLAEGTIFSVPEWIEGDRDAFDVWTDNMAMMVGFKAKHIMKSAGGVLGDLKASFESPSNGQKNRLDFESRLRMRMDAPSDGGMALTKDEAAELERYGYGDLRELVESAGDPTKGEIELSNLKAKSSKHIFDDGTHRVVEETIETENAPEIVSRLTDMVTDPRISEAARAKMYYYATGRKLPMSTVMRGELIEDGEGGFIVESQGANGVITSRSFKSRKAADLELERIHRQTELNSIEIGERYQQTVDFENRLQEACRTVAAETNGDPVAIYRICEEARRNHLRGGDKQFDEAQQNVLRKVTEAMGEFEETGATDAIRGRINEKYGVDIDAAIRKEANRRTQAEQTAIDEYIDELIPDKAKERPVQDADAEDITNQKLLTDEPEQPANEFTDNEPVDPRFDGGQPEVAADPHQPGGVEQPIGRAVMKYQDRPVEVLSGRVVTMEDGTMVDNERSDKTIVIRDLATGAIEMVSPDAILSYEEYKMNADAETAQPAAEQEAAPEAPATVQPKYTSGQIKIRNSDGTETRGVLTGYVDEEGKHEYYVEGDLQHLHYATDNELDLILSDYQPDEQPQQETPVEQTPTEQAPTEPTAEAPATVEAPAEGNNAAENIPAEGNNGGENIPTDNEDYQQGYTYGMQEVEKYSNEKLDEEIDKLGTEAERLTVFGKGLYDAMAYERQRRMGTQQPTEPQEGIMPQGVTKVGNVEIPQGDGSTRAFTVGKNAEGENVVLDESGFLWGHDGNGANMQPHRPGANMPTWSDEQIAALGNVQPINLEPTTVPETAESVPNNGETAANPPISSQGEAAQPMTVENPTETVPTEAGNNLAENIISPSVDELTVPQNGNNAANNILAPQAASRLPQPTEAAVEPTPLQRIPRDEKGNPMFEQAETPETAWDALVEYSEGDAGTAKEIADAMAEEKRKAFEKAQKLKLKGKTPAEMLASKKANAAELAKAQAEYEHWQKMAGVEQSRQNAIRAEQEAEARRLAAERAEADKAEKEAREEAARLEREALEGIPEWHMDTPENARKRGVRRFSGQMFTRQEPVQGVVGKEVEVKFSQKDLPKGRVVVMEASQLQPSHVQGHRNPMFFIDEAQPKNRAEAVSMFAAKEMAEGIRPQEITGSTTAYTGAPTVKLVAR